MDDLDTPLLIVVGRKDRLIPWHRPRTADWLAARLAVPAPLTTKAG